MRVLVCGGRDYADQARVWNFLDDLSRDNKESLMPDKPIVVIHGNCGYVKVIDGKKRVFGADWLAREWAICNWVVDLPYPPDWTVHGRAAGPIRNQQMLDEGKPDIVVAFPGGKGTADMVGRAKRAGVKVIEVTA